MKSRKLLLLGVSVCLLLAALPARADQSGKDKTAPVQQLAERVEKVIKIVEDSTLPCETRNSVVRRLRVLDDALRSGRRSSARAIVMAARRYHWKMEAAKLIGPELGSSLQTQLIDLPDQIGFGWPDKPGPTRNWKPLPSCEVSTGVVASVVGSYTPTATDPEEDIKIILKMLLGEIPEVGGLLDGLVDLLWPAGSTADSNGFAELVDQATYDLVKARLAGLMSIMLGDTGWNTQVAQWNTDCNDTTKPASLCADEALRTLWVSFQSKFDNFKEEGAMFQLPGHEVNLLPLYAQYMNLWMGFLRDGVMLHDKYWSKVSGVDTSDLSGTEVTHVLNAANTDRGIGYVNQIYRCGAAFDPANPTVCKGGLAGLASSDWATRNTYIRDKILNVLDFSDTWKFMNPRAYPDGVPGGLKLTRMIYSDPIGTVKGTPHYPSNVPGPLKETSAWTVRIDEAPFVSHLYIDAVQATSPPLLGPAVSGPVTGDTSQPVNHAHYYNLSASGPIIKAQGKSMAKFIGDDYVTDLPHWIRYDYANGNYDQAGDSVKDATSLVFHYDGEVLATVQSNGASYGQAASVVFGFRYADSFEAAGEAIGVASGKCIDLPSWADGTQAVIHSCYQPPTSAQIWTYDPILHQIWVSNPAEYDPANPTQSGKHCLDAAGTRVVINKCDDGAYSSTGKSTQLWTIEGVEATTAKIINVKSGLVIAVSNYSTADGALLILESYAGNAAQQWRAHDSLTGEIHGVGSGRCVDVPNSSTTPGTQVQIYDCKGNAAQQWTYAPTTKQLIYANAPSLCLEAQNGGTSSGAAVQINTCTGTAGQQWTLNGDGFTIANFTSGLVLDVPGGATANNTLLQLYRSNDTLAQEWSRTSSRGGVLYAVGAGKCLTVPLLTKGTQAVIQTCAKPLSAAQTWTYHPIAQTYTVNSPSGLMCLEAGAGFKAVVNDCNGASSQRWVLDFMSSAVITFNNSNTVLDVAGGGTADGTPVVWWTRQGGTNQQWVWSLN